PEGVNVGFMEVIDSGHIKLRVYERGVGETQACGSGACAAVATKRQHQQLAETVEVSMSGGTITVQWQGPNHDLFQTGPANKVYDGRMKL
ncbi:MAG: diaminopimelate epimerase, partial [Pseudomonadota bacterium]|nr:diaminopimelate epimerase [Pseudomonadota bacterium]